MLVLFVAGLLLRWLVAFHPHSGMGRPPMYGDFEAQRHWVEITNALPPKDWYANTTDNDLQYWGLDYPPLSAWHAKLIGVSYQFLLQQAAKVARQPYPIADGEDVEVDTSAWVTHQWNRTFGLHVSRGAEDPTTRSVMRVSAWVTDLLAFAGPAVLFLHLLSGIPTARNHRQAQGSVAPLGIDRSVLSAAMSGPALLLMCPLPQIFVDHGHFQFNAVPLGMVVTTGIAAVAFGRTQRFLGLLVGVAAMATAIMFKQIALYYSLGMASYALAVCLRCQRAAGTAISQLVVAVGVGVTILALCLGPPLRASDVVSRMFPFQRGLYEDKVANVWCALSPVLKLHLLLPRNALVPFCAGATMVAAAPACLSSGWMKKTGSSSAACGPHVDSLRLCLLLAASSVSFFLFSFQVHEKAILFVVTPVLLAGCIAERLLRMSNFGDAGNEATAARQWIESLPFAATHFTFVALFSLFQLAQKDRLVPVYGALLALGAVHVAFCWTQRYRRHPMTAHHLEGEFVTRAPFVSVSTLSMIAVFGLETVYVPPPRFPDLTALLLAAVSCAHFVAYLVYFSRGLWLVRRL